MMSSDKNVFEVKGEEGKYFKTLARDGSKRLVDFVLVSETRPEESDYLSDCKKRETFISQLEEAGLEIEEDEGSDLRFVKLHLPMEVLKRYAEILKLRLKLKGNLQNTVQGSSQSWLKRIQRLFNPKPLLRDHEQEFSATYSIDKDYLFEDDTVKFFSPAARSRIVEFILQRERFLPEEDGGDDSAFGFNRLVNDGVYLAGFPLHDGTIRTQGSQRQLLSQEWACWSKLFTYQPLDAIREGVKYYFADFVRKGGPPPPFTDKIFAKKKLRIWGVPPLPLYGHSPEKCSSKSAKNGVFCPKNTCFWSKK